MKSMRRLCRAGLVLPAAAWVLALAPANATAATGFGDAVTFIGDSVTAGFGYCGAAENAPSVTCGPNQEFADAWYFGDNSLYDCAPPAIPNDACSNDNDNGRPWDASAWKPGPASPVIAYPYQIAASQLPGTVKASVSDWAMTGSTPANWDPSEGAYAPELKRLRDQYVVMTLGANPILSDFTNITFPISSLDIVGKCVSATGYKSGGTWYSGPASRAVGCARTQWERLDQTRHLVAIYRQLLRQSDRVVVMGYYRACSWSFGNWQPAASLFSGPSSGGDCRDQVRHEAPGSGTTMTQWDQATDVANAVNDYIHAAVLQVRAWARDEWPGTSRYEDLVWTLPDQSAWAMHQPHSPHGSWVFLNDTWIHPSKAGAGELARTVTHAMCVSFRRWCGVPPVWR